MVEVIYRIYEVADEETAKKNMENDSNIYLYSSESKARNTELIMDCMIAENREAFKQAIREYWGESIAFRYAKNMKPGQLYCIIIGEHCYNTEKYFRKTEYDCDFCGSHVTSYAGHSVKLSDSEIKYDMYNLHEFEKKRFCCTDCKDKWKSITQSTLKADENTHFFVTRDMFTEKISGYIYKITKKSTKEFYVGQTMYAPMFRWAEHMKTDRFPISLIEDYIFEVIEIVQDGENILEREKYWIQKLFKEHPDLSLNISQTQLLRKEID